MTSKTCSHDCTKLVNARGLCAAHYAAARRRERGAERRAAKQPVGTPCGLEGCGEPRKARGLCSGHYQRARRGKIDPDVLPMPVEVAGECSFGGCGRLIHADGLCSAHYLQRREGRPLAAIREWARVAGAECAIESCSRPAAHANLCLRHYQRKIEGDQKWDRPIKAKRADGEGHLNADGYLLVRRDGRNIMEHRWVMEKILGRRLIKGENVHHINTVRDDNSTDGPLIEVGGKLRSGNLELWSTAQPAGSAVPDKVVYARTLLGLYGNEHERAMYADQASKAIERGAVTEPDSTETGEAMDD